MLYDDIIVSTDQFDYAPGDTATITADGFEEGGIIAFQILHLDAGEDVIDYLESGDGHDIWYVEDGGPDDLDGVVKV